MTCSTCEYFTKNEYEETYLEKSDRQNNPEPKGLLQGIHSIFRPCKYKPYLDNIERIIDSIIIENRDSGVCSRFPKAVKVKKDYRCGEYVKRLDKISTAI